MLATLLDRRPAVGPLVRALLVLLLVGAGAAAAAPAHADDTVGIAGAPSDGTDPDGRSRFSYQVQPGQQVTDAYLVRNTGTTDQSVEVVATDAYNTEDGAFALLATDEPPKDAGGWVTLDGGQKSLTIALAAGAQQVVPFTIAVPADARPGDHPAGLVVSASAIEGQVKVERRVATRLYVRVAGELQPALTISSISASQPAGTNPLTGPATVTVTVTNTGNVALGAKVVAGAKTWFGLTAARAVHDEIPELLPGATRSVTFDVPGVGRSGLLRPYVDLQPVVDADALDPGALAPVHRDTTVVAVPWILLGLVALAVGGWFGLRAKRRRDARLAQEWIAYTQEEARRAAAGTPDLAR
ncbi:WxL protein peptidoglycan domain-containing protein [Cellulomonas sp. P5_C6]